MLFGAALIVSAELRVQVLVVRVQDFGLSGVSGSGFRIWWGFWVSGFGFRVQDFGCGRDLVLFGAALIVSAELPYHLPQPTLRRCEEKTIQWRQLLHCFARVRASDRKSEFRRRGLVFLSTSQNATYRTTSTVILQTKVQARKRRRDS